MRSLETGCQFEPSEPAVKPWGLSDLVVTAHVWILILVLTSLLADLKQFFLLERGRPRAVPPYSVLPSVWGTWCLSGNYLSQLPLQVDVDKPLFSSVGRRENKLLLPLLPKRKFSVFPYSHELEYGLSDTQI